MAHVLVVDSEPGVRMFTQVVFRDAGHRVTAVGDAETALAELDSDRYAIAVVGDDLGMHRGVDLLDAVEALDRRPRTRLALHTADPRAHLEVVRPGRGVDIVARPAGSEELLGLTRLAPGLELA